MTWLGEMLCWFGYHDWRVWRVLKPHLYLAHGKWLGCDLECARCKCTSWWRKVEREHWKSPFAGLYEQHPNSVCPCGVCKLAKETP